MAYNLSAAQQQAINERGGNLLVAAGAGSGKTTVLVQRVLARLLDDEQPTDIDRLLILTFTNAAAAEMRARIGDGLTERLIKEPGTERLHRQLALLQQAPITTIHSFCLQVVRNNFYLLGLDAGFRIPSEVERAILHQETLAAFMESEYEKEDDLLSALADCYGGKRDDAVLLALVDELYRFSRSQPHPNEWLRGAAAAYAQAQKVEDYAWSGFLLEALQQDMALFAHGLEQARDLAQTEDIPPAWLAQIIEEVESVRRVAAAKDWAGFLQALAALNFARLPAAAKTGDAEAKEAFRALRDSAKEEIKKLQKQHARRGLPAMEQDLCALAPLMERLATLAIDYGAALDAEKRRRNLLDFDDMEHFCLRLLEDEANGVALALRDSFEELLIDEYQDINAVQERILQLLSRGDNRFAVGDVKQSIYRFRLAEPTLFLHKYHAYGAGQGGRRIDLNLNYRSSGQVISAVNFIFRQLMSAQVAELDYDAESELKAGRDTVGAAAELWLIERGANAEAPEEEEEAETEAAEEPNDAQEHPLAAEARLLARRILELHEEGYAFSDMAVLLRAAKNREAVLAQEFARLGIPALAAGKPDYLQTPEIGLMLAILAIVDNPLQELELAGVLRSPLFGFSLDELAELRFAAPQQQLLLGLQALASEEGSLARKCRDFLARLEDWRAALRASRISELIWRIYRETGLYQLAGALPEGAQRQENLLLLYQRAREYEAGSYRGLFRFLLFLADGRGKAAESGMGLAEGEQAVRVMSIHRSKGLEFPVVFVANAGGAFSLLDEQRDIIWHKQLGLAAKVVQRRERRKFPSLAHQALARRLHSEALAEEMRVLYVALTRARERLIITAGVKDIEKAAVSWLKLAEGQGPRLDGHLLARDKKPLDWLGQALLRHPDATELRRAAGIMPGSAREQTLLLPGEGQWRCHIVSREELLAPVENAASPALPKNGEPLPESPQRGEVEAVLSYRYPYQEACNQAAKRTVSELNRLSQLPPQQAEEEAAPLAAAQAAQRGTAQHKLLQYLDFAAAQNAEQVAGQLAHLVEQGLCSAEEAALTDVASIARFAASPLGQRFAQASRCLREAPFTYALPAQELVPAAAAEDKLVLQGMIDAAFWEGEGWVLLDYKTGAHGHTEQELKQRYAAQLSYYRRALEDIWGQPVKETWLCFLDLGKNIPVEG